MNLYLVYAIPQWTKETAEAVGQHVVARDLAGAVRAAGLEGGEVISAQLASRDPLFALEQVN